MNCPKCSGSGGIEARRAGFQIAMDVCAYDMTCGECGHTWKLQRGIMRRPSEEQCAEWANVQYLPNAREQQRQEESDKIKRGECPRCGARIVELQREPWCHLVKVWTECEARCGYESEHTGTPEYAAGIVLPKREEP